MTFNVNSCSDKRLHDEYHNRATSLKPFYVRGTQLSAWTRAHRAVRVTKPLAGTIISFDEATTSTLKTKIERLVKVIFLLVYSLR